jgi:hypothetical protein
LQKKISMYKSSPLGLQIIFFAQKRHYIALIEIHIFNEKKIGKKNMAPFSLLCRTTVQGRVCFEHLISRRIFPFAVERASIGDEASID